MDIAEKQISTRPNPIEQIKQSMKGTLEEHVLFLMSADKTRARANFRGGGYHWDPNINYPGASVDRCLSAFAPDSLFGCSPVPSLPCLIAYGALLRGSCLAGKVLPGLLQGSVPQMYADCCSPTF